MNNQAAGALPPAFNLADYKPVEEMAYADRVAVWKQYCEFRRLSNTFQVYSNSEAFKFVEAQLRSIRTHYLDHFDSTSLIDPQYL